VAGYVEVHNIIPNSLSGETGQDSEPNLAVNPQDPTQMVATAFTRPPGGGTLAPIFISTDGGTTWSLRNVVPGATATFITKDITVAFGTAGGTLYAGILRGDTDPGTRMQVLRSTNFQSLTTMAVLSDRTGPDQPWVVARSSGNADRLWVGSNSLVSSGDTATIDATADARAASPTFAQTQPEARQAVYNNPPVRLASHSDGTVYAAHIRVARAVANNLSFDVVVTRDDSWGTGANGFTDLVDSRDNVVGTRVADDLYAYWNATMGQERLGADLAIAVDPTDSDTVWVAWGYKYGGPSSSIPWTIDVARSTDRGRNWAPIRRTVVQGKNPALAVNSSGALGFLYQQLTDTDWVTTLEVTTDAWETPAETHVLHRAPWTTPGRSFFPYLGDYLRLVSVGRSFYGIFSGSNVPDPTHFPSGVSYQRNADWGTQQLLGIDGVSPVPTSIDPFFFQWRASVATPIIPRGPGIVPRTIIPRTIVPRSPRIPIEPRTVINPPPIVPGITPGPITPEVPEPPTDLDL